jgi:hypothetical protein
LRVESRSSEFENFVKDTDAILQKNGAAAAEQKKFGLADRFQRRRTLGLLKG